MDSDFFRPQAPRRGRSVVQGSRMGAGRHLRVVGREGLQNLGVVGVASRLENDLDDDLVDRRVEPGALVENLDSEGGCVWRCGGRSN